MTSTITKTNRESDISLKSQDNKKLANTILGVESVPYYRYKEMVYLKDKEIAYKNKKIDDLSHRVCWNKSLYEEIQLENYALRMRFMPHRKKPIVLYSRFWLLIGFASVFICANLWVFCYTLGVFFIVNLSILSMATLIFFIYCMMSADEGSEYIARRKRQYEKDLHELERAEKDLNKLLDGET